MEKLFDPALWGPQTRTDPAKTREALREDVFGDEQFPQMLVRVGWAAVNADPLPATPRRALTESVTRLDGSSLDF